VSYHFLRDVRQSDPACSLLAWKARFRADQYVTETIKMLPEKPEPILLAQIFTKIAGRGRIHAGQPSVTPV
jgi:putative transposase